MRFLCKSCKKNKKIKGTISKKLEILQKLFDVQVVRYVDIVFAKHRNGHFWCNKTISAQHFVFSPICSFNFSHHFSHLARMNPLIWYFFIRHVCFLDESFDEYQYNDQPDTLNLPIQYQSYPYQAKIAPAAVRSRVRRDWVNRRGVYDECCRKPCSVQELRSYCKPKNWITNFICVTKSNIFYFAIQSFHVRSRKVPSRKQEEKRIGHCAIAEQWYLELNTIWICFQVRTRVAVGRKTTLLRLPSANVTRACWFAKVYHKIICNRLKSVSDEKGFVWVSTQQSLQLQNEQLPIDYK